MMVILGLAQACHSIAGVVKLVGDAEITGISGNAVNYPGLSVGDSFEVTYDIYLNATSETSFIEETGESYARTYFDALSYSMYTAAGDLLLTRTADMVMVEGSLFGVNDQVEIFFDNDNTYGPNADAYLQLQKLVFNIDVFEELDINEMLGLDYTLTEDTYSYPLNNLGEGMFGWGDLEYKIHSLTEVSDKVVFVSEPGVLGLMALSFTAVIARRRKTFALGGKEVLG